jgi:hypothetical protein
MEAIVSRCARVNNRLKLIRWTALLEMEEVSRLKGPKSDS